MSEKNDWIRGLSLFFYITSEIVGLTVLGLILGFGLYSATGRFKEVIVFTGFIGFGGALYRVFLELKKRKLID